MWKKTVICVALLLLSSCALPGAVDAKLGALEQKVEQKADNTVVAKEIERVDNRINQTTQITSELMTWKKTIQAETINYGGAGWVVLLVVIVLIILLVAKGLKRFFEYKRMLTLVTDSVFYGPAEMQKSIKSEINRRAKIENKDKDKKILSQFCGKNRNRV
jgi:hypothetical protein